MQRKSQSDKVGNNLRRLTALLILTAMLCGLLTGCGSGTESQSASLPDSTLPIESRVIPDTEESSGVLSEDTPPTIEETYIENITSETSAEDTADSSDTSDSAEPPIPETESAPADSEQTAPAVSAPQQTVEMSIPDEPAPPLASTPPVTAATTAATTPKPPAEVIIPEVRTVSSPCEKTFTAGDSFIDYSNASRGYVSVKYGGGSDKIRVLIICGDSTYDYMLPADDEIRYFPLSCGSGEYTLQLWEHDHDNFYANPINETISLTVSDDVAMFLYPNYYVNFNQRSNVVKKSAEVCAGKTGTIEKIAAIFGFITDNVIYDKQLSTTVKSGYVPNPDATLKSLKGICFDYSALFAAMARAQGIPTRLVIGYASPDIYHAWNEVYTTETGWITPELFLKQSGYNLLDSTFYAGASDKSQISDYISEKSNYTALYYY